MSISPSSTSSIPARAKQYDLQNVLLVIPFILLFLIQLAHHQMWRDELNAWGIVVASPTPVSLYQHIRYEGHPSLWYIVLWIVSRFTSNPIAMKCVEALVGTAIYLLIALRSPFTRWEKVLLFLGYYISFEYTVLSRMYGLCLLLVLFYIYRRLTRPDDWAVNVSILALVANTDMSGLILSFALLVEYVTAHLSDYRARESSSKALRRAAIAYAAGVACTALALRISPHISWRTTGRMFIHARELDHLVQAVLSYIVVPWFPIGIGFPDHFWNPSISPLDAHMGIIAMLPVIVAAQIFLFRRHRNLLLLLAVTACGAILFAHLIYMGGTRHYGVTFTAFLAALWMLRYGRSFEQFSLSARVTILLFLATTAAGGLTAAVLQWHHPFSNGRAAVAWLKANRLDKMPIVGTPDTSVAGIAEQLQRSVYFLDCDCSDTYLLFSNRRDDFNAEQTPERLELASEKLHAREMILMTTYPLPPERIRAINNCDLSLDLLAKFTDAEEFEENFYIYKVVSHH